MTCDARVLIQPMPWLKYIKLVHIYMRTWWNFSLKMMADNVKSSESSPNWETSCIKYFLIHITIDYWYVLQSDTVSSGVIYDWYEIVVFSTCKNSHLKICSLFCSEIVKMWNNEHRVSWHSFYLNSMQSSALRRQYRNITALLNFHTNMKHCYNQR